MEPVTDNTTISDDKEKNNKSGKSLFKRVVAMIGVSVLLLMYFLLFIFAIIDLDGWQRYFMACLACTIAIPILLWINIFLYDRLVSGKKNNKEQGE